MAVLEQQKTGGKSEAAELVKTVLYAVGIALVLRIFLFQPFNIPTGSMIPNLQIGDYLFVSKYAYGYSKHSFPFSLGPFEGRILGSEPERGDVIVFKLPSDGRTDYIKRLIGLPGDRIQMIDGRLFINGEPVRKERIDDEIYRDSNGSTHRIARYRETLPNGVSYVVREVHGDRGANDDTRPFVVPEGHYFMMGDNRDNSADSRTPHVGFVPYENLVGRAERIFFSADGAKARLWEVWKWPFAIRYGRILHAVE
ncbi:MAG: signal peptidase I [Parvularculaceae bacterium]